MEKNTATNICIRPAVEADLQALTTLGEITFREAYAAQNTAADIDHYITTYLNSRYTLLDLQDPHTVFYLAQTPLGLAGYAKIKIMPADLLGNTGRVAELKRIYVLRSYYGTGIAQQLLEQALVFARQNHLPAVNLAVWKENPRAIAFYKKAGFEITGETSFDWGTGKVDSDWVMQKQTG